MESQPKNPGLRKNPEKLSPMHLSYDSAKLYPPVQKE